jgi:hypothetical protein
VVRFDDLRAREQSHVGSTTVRTVLDEADGPATVEQHDRTLGDGHCTHVAVRGAPDAELVAAVAFAPENQESRVGRPHHGDAVEAFHDREHDYLASATGIAETVGRRPSTFETLLADEPEPLTATPSGDRHEDTASGGDVVAVAPLRGDGATPRRTTVATLLPDRTATDRPAALDRVRSLAATRGSPAARGDATPETPVPDPPDHPRADAIAADLRALALLAAPTGARIAGPEFDPFYAATGGYGYTWFRGDAEVARGLLRADRALDLGIGDWHDRSAAFYCETRRLIVSLWLVAAGLAGVTAGASLSFGAAGAAVPLALAEFVAAGSRDALGPLQPLYALFDTQVSLLDAAVALLFADADGQWDPDEDLREAYEVSDD